MDFGVNGKKLDTPWGVSQVDHHVSDGLVSVSTASHGGFWLSPERVATMRAAIPEFQPFAGYPWLEEDCDAVVALVVFPGFFMPGQVAEARNIVLKMAEMFPRFVCVADYIEAHP